MRKNKKQLKEEIGDCILQLLEELEYEEMSIMELAGEIDTRGHIQMNSKRLGQYLSYWMKRNPNILQRRQVMKLCRFTTFVGYYQEETVEMETSLNRSIHQLGNSEPHGLQVRHKIIGNA
jgi:hypothetical protein